MGNPNLKIITKPITQEMWAEIDAIVDKYRGRPGSLIPVLEECQNVTGYLPIEVQDRISQGLNIPASTVYGVVTFYALFTMVPRGRHTIKICLGTACYVRGGKANLDFLRRELAVEVKGTTTDLRFSLDSVRCLGACGMAPAMVVDDDTYAQVSKKNVLEILDQYQ
jgi:NADH:ubiquinone oxidoreductase subunit E